MVTTRPKPVVRELLFTCRQCDVRIVQVRDAATSATVLLERAAHPMGTHRLFRVGPMIFTSPIPSEDYDGPRFRRHDTVCAYARKVLDRYEIKPDAGT